MIGGYEHEWPPAFESFVARELVGRDAAEVVRLGDLAEAPAVLGAGGVSALVVQAERLGLTGLLTLQECRRVSPETALVVVGTTGRFGMKNALEGGATAFLAWPASAEALRQALGSGGVRGADAGRERHEVAGGRMEDALAGEATLSKQEQADTVLALAALDAQLHSEAPAPREPRAQLEARRAAARRRLPPDVVALYDRAQRSGREPVVTKLAASGTCSGCYLQLATSIAQRVRKGRCLAACPHCGRLLYEPAASAAPVAPPAEAAPRRRARRAR